MTEPVTVSKTLIVPNTGDLPGAWGTSALNPNFQLIDAMFGGVTTISLGAATTIVLTAPATTGIWGGSVPQASNAMIKFTGTQSGNAFIYISLPGFYLIDNQTAPAETFYIQLLPYVGGTAAIGVPQGMVSHVFYDSSYGIKFVNPGLPGTALDLHGWTDYPPWMNISFPRPYLIKDGNSYSTASYPNLAWALRGQFGNSNPPGVSFVLPDERARARIAYDPNSTGRLTAAVSGVDGATMGSAGGDQRMQSHTHVNTLNDPGHQHDEAFGGITGSVTTTVAVGAQVVMFSGGKTGTATTGITLTNANIGTGASQNVQPSIVSFLPLIKT